MDNKERILKHRYNADILPIAYKLDDISSWEYDYGITKDILNNDGWVESKVLFYDKPYNDYDIIFDPIHYNDIIKLDITFSKDEHIITTIDKKYKRCIITLKDTEILIYNINMSRRATVMSMCLSKNGKFEKHVDEPVDIKVWIKHVEDDDKDTI